MFDDQIFCGVSVAAALLVLFSTMLDPRLSAGLAIAALLILGITTIAKRNKRNMSGRKKAS